MSKFFVLGLLALFSFSALALPEFYYQTRDERNAACDAYLVFKAWPTSSCAGGYIYDIYARNDGVDKAIFWYIEGAQCPAGQAPDPNNGGLCTVILPTPAECLALPDEVHRHVSTVLAPTMSPTVVVKDNCEFVYGSSSAGGAYYNCIVALDGLGLICDATYTSTDVPTSAPTDFITNSDTGTFTDGGQSSGSTTISPDVVQTDVPAVGDTTVTSTTTETDAITEQVIIENKSTAVDVVTMAGGDIVKTTTTETVTLSDGSQQITVTTAFTQADTSVSTDTINPSTGSVTHTDEVVSGSTGSTTDVTNKSASGDITSSSTSETGSGGSGTSNGFEEGEEGTCLDSGDCNSDVDTDGAIDGIDGIFDGAMDSVTGDSFGSGDFLSNVVVLPSGACTNPTFSHSSALGSFNKTIDICTNMQTFRDGLGWLFYILTVFFIYRIATSGN